MRASTSPSTISACASPGRNDQPTQKRDALDTLRLHQPWDNGRLDERRFAGAAGAGDQQKGLALAGLGGDLFGRLRDQGIAAEEDRRVLELVGLQSAKRIAEPGRRRRSLVDVCLDSPIEQLAQRLFEPRCELFQAVVFR